jgi:hypothetical protein
MPKTDERTAPPDVASVENRLAGLLETPLLERAVPHLPPETLHQLIRHYGLESCGALVTASTPAQLTSLLDLDLWRPAQPSGDDRFDADRFGEWLEALVDVDPSVAARTVAALDENLVVAGLSRYVRVFDPGIFEPTSQSDDEPVDRDEAMREGDVLDADDTTDTEPDGGAPPHDPSGTGLECELGGYVVRARRADAWDATVALLVELEAEQGPYFHAVMQGCRRLSHSRPEVDGLDELFQAPEQHLHDVGVAREDRRSQRGYATPADARAFLQTARQPRPARPVAAHPIVAAYFRAAEEAPWRSTESAPTSERLREASTSNADAIAVARSIVAATELLDADGTFTSRRLLEAAGAGPQDATLPHLRRRMAYVRDADETAYLTRGRELAFLANALLAGCSVQSRPFTPQEASDAAAAACNLGLEHRPDAAPPDALLVDHDLVTAFEVGWSVLHRDVSLFVAEQLIAILSDVRCADRDINGGLVALRLELEKQTGTPWRARGAADVLALLDAVAGAAVLGLLSECPVLPAALTAVLEGRTTTVSPTEFAFISTAAQIDGVRVFMRTLPGLLSR